MIIDEQRIILINGSRLLGDMLHNIICKADHLEMVQEVNWYEELPAAIEGTEADWVLMSLPFDTSFPRWVVDHIATHPYMRFLAIFIGSGKVSLKSLNSPEAQLEDPSLDDLIHILECHPQQLQEIKVHWIYGDRCENPKESSVGKRILQEIQQQIVGTHKNLKKEMKDERKYHH